MVEVYIPPVPTRDGHRIRVINESEAISLLSVFARRSDGSSARDEVIMVALGPGRELLAVVAFGDVRLDHMVDDPRPLVCLAFGTGSRSVLLGQVGVGSTDVVDAHRIIGSALAVDDIDLEAWLDLSGELFRVCE